MNIDASMRTVIRKSWLERGQELSIRITFSGRCARIVETTFEKKKKEKEKFCKSWDQDSVF